MYVALTASGEAAFDEAGLARLMMPACPASVIGDAVIQASTAGVAKMT